MNGSLAALDSRGNAIAEGAMALIPVLPDWLVHDLPAEEVATMRTVESTVMRVVEIDAYGYVWFGMADNGHWFCLRPEEITLIDLA